MFQIPFCLLGIVLAWCQMRVSRLHPISKSGRHQMLPWEEEFLSRFDEDTIIDIAEGAIYMEVQSLLSTCYQVMKSRCCASPEDKVISNKTRTRKSQNETLSERLERWNAWQNRAYWQAKLDHPKDDSLEPQGQTSSGKTKQCVDARKPSTNRRLRLENTRGTKGKTGNPWRRLQERKRGFCWNGKIVYQEQSGH